MHTSYRRSAHRARSYRGEQTFGGCLVYAGETLLDKHLFVHRVSPGVFDWGPDADDDRACQLAIALLAPTFGLEVAVDEYHLFATNFVKRGLTGDSWTVRSQALKQSDLRTKFAHREYPENTALNPEEIDIATIDFDEIDYATEIALVRRYQDVLWMKGNQRANLRRLQEIHTGTLDPAEEPVTQQWVSMNLGLTAGAAKRALVSEFETMGELASWVLYATSLTDRPHIDGSTAKQLRARRATFIRWFGGEEYIPQYDDDQQTLTATDSGGTEQSVDGF
ncbi:DUF6166 domain-containing protein [Salinirubellus sp. GCM10025818]|uniref:DUF6166 domain-containing protein n=1 Tax=Salinirubellus TaxID=2162630 RepID=UPI0030CAB476